HRRHPARPGKPRIEPKRRHRDDALFEEHSMTYGRTLLKTLALLGPMAVALSYATEPAYADVYDWCHNAYNYDHDPRCAYLHDYSYPYYYGYPPYPYGGFFFFGD